MEDVRYSTPASDGDRLYATTITRDDFSWSFGGQHKPKKVSYAGNVEGAGGAALNRPRRRASVMFRST